MPHAWVESDYIRSVLDLFAYERVRDAALVLGAGVPAAWLTEGVGIAGLRTPYGLLAYSMNEHDARMAVDIAAGPRVPPGGFVLTWPFTSPPRETRVNNRVARWQNGELRIRELPAHIEVRR
jgi:hypothetical protein